MVARQFCPKGTQFEAALKKEKKKASSKKDQGKNKTKDFNFTSVCRIRKNPEKF